jgi:hypothetical protein
MPTEQIEARLKTHTISPQRTAFIEMALRAEQDQEQAQPVPPLPFKNAHCMCVNCLGLLWSPHCKAPINWLEPHEGNRCPYCNGPLLPNTLGKDWPASFYDSLYRVLGYEQVKSCDNCRCWM